MKIIRLRSQNIFLDVIADYIGVNTRAHIRIHEHTLNKETNWNPL